MKVMHCLLLKTVFMSTTWYPRISNNYLLARLQPDVRQWDMLSPSQISCWLYHRTHDWHLSGTVQAIMTLEAS